MTINNITNFLNSHASLEASVFLEQFKQEFKPKKELWISLLEEILSRPPSKSNLSLSERIIQLEDLKEEKSLAARVDELRILCPNKNKRGRKKNKKPKDNQWNTLNTLWNEVNPAITFVSYLEKHVVGLLHVESHNLFDQMIYSHHCYLRSTAAKGALKGNKTDWNEIKRKMGMITGMLNMANHVVTFDGKEFTTDNDFRTVFIETSTEFLTIILEKLAFLANGQHKDLRERIEESKKVLSFMLKVINEDKLMLLEENYHSHFSAHVKSGKLANASTLCDEAIQRLEYWTEFGKVLEKPLSSFQNRIRTIRTQLKNPDHTVLYNIIRELYSLEEAIETETEKFYETLNDNIKPYISKDRSDIDWMTLTKYVQQPLRLLEGIIFAELREKLTRSDSPFVLQVDRWIPDHDKFKYAMDEITFARQIILAGLDTYKPKALKFSISTFPTFDLISNHIVAVQARKNTPSVFLTLRCFILLHLHLPRLLKIEIPNSLKEATLLLDLLNPNTLEPAHLNQYFSCRNKLQTYLETMAWLLLHSMERYEMLDKECHQVLSAPFTKKIETPAPPLSLKVQEEEIIPQEMEADPQVPEPVPVEISLQEKEIGFVRKLKEVTNNLINEKKHEVQKILKGELRRKSNYELYYLRKGKVSEILKLLAEDGWKELRIKGDHHIFKHPILMGEITVPYSSPAQTLKPGTFNSIAKIAGWMDV